MKRSAAARAALAVAVLLPLVVLAAAVGLSTGAGALSLRDALRGHEPDATVLFRLRMPRVLLAAEVGAALSVAGVALQALLRNPLADPFVFGLSGGAAIGTAIVTVASGSAVGVAATYGAAFFGLLPAQLAAMAGAMAAALLVFTLGRARGQLEPSRALLVGVVFNSFASALVLSVEAVLRPDQMQAVSLWLAGTLGYEALPRVAHGGDPRDLLAGRADAMVAYSTNEPFVLEQLGAPYRTFSPVASGIDSYGDNLCTSEAEVKARPDRVAAFRAASVKGWAYALAHKEAMVDLILEQSCALY